MRELNDAVPPWFLHEKRGELVGPVTSPEITLLDVGPTIPIAVGRIKNDDIYTIPVSGHAAGSGFSHVDNFLQAIRSENPSVLTCPPAVARRTERAMFAACESLRTRSRVTVHL